MTPDHIPPLAPARDERAAMLAGVAYDDADPALVAERRACREAMRAFNAGGHMAHDDARRLAILRELLADVGERVAVIPPLTCDYGSNIQLGAGTFLNFDCLFLDCAPVTIGVRCAIGPRCQFLTALHPMEDHAARAAGIEWARPITVGDNVWFGGGVIVCPGVTIGSDAVIGAGSVVTRDIPPRVFAAGNPCRVIREL